MQSFRQKILKTFIKYIALNPAGVVQHGIIAGYCVPLIFLFIGHSYLSVYHCFNIFECLFCFNFIFEIDDNFVPIILGQYQIWK